jgi:uncharacterized membrane protein YeaQ/YmgE (transglycosylase-associated protein family)
MTHSPDALALVSWPYKEEWQVGIVRAYAIAESARAAAIGRRALVRWLRTVKRSRQHMGMLLAWVIVGGIAGWLASLVVRGTGLGLLGDIIVGVIGAFLGGFLLSLLLPGTFSFSGFNLGSLLIAFIGAVLLLLIVRAVNGRQARV